MAHVDFVLRPPSYGWEDAHGRLIKPSNGQIIREFFNRINVLENRKNWHPLSQWASLVILFPCLVIFATVHFTWPLFAAGFVYGMMGLGSHATVWYHRFGTHKAFEFAHPVWRFLTRHLMVKAVSEEMYIVSHFVHHSKSDKPGDPYNPAGGFLYCFLADANHQPIAHDLSEKDYDKTVAFVAHTGMYVNTYEQYQYWGSITHPAALWSSWIGNWIFWYGVFFLVGGHGLATAVFGGACIWNLGIRTFNYGAHGSGDDQRVDGEDFSRGDMSINQLWPGFIAGEWHNNHHLFARSARSGYKPWQLDWAFYYIRTLHFFGAISSYRDSKALFYSKHYLPFLEAQKNKAASAK